MLHHSYELSDEQQAAVACDDSAIVLVASAGSGKTEVVARRVERLLTEAQHHDFQVLALSYTQKAANELDERFRARLGDLSDRVEALTVHGFAHALLRMHGTRVGLPLEPEVLARDEDRSALFSSWMADQGRNLEEDAAAVLRGLDLARARLEEQPLLSEWSAALTHAGAVDYPEMLVRGCEILRLRSTQIQMPQLYRHVIVDEAQNLTPAQYEFLIELIGKADQGQPKIDTMIVGDENQSIIGFAGADPNLISKFRNEFDATSFELTYNFRSADALSRLASSVAGELAVKSRKQPDQRSVNYPAPGRVTRSDSASEAHEADLVTKWIRSLLNDGLPLDALADGDSRSIAPEEIAVLGRSASTLRHIEKALLEADIQFAVSSTAEDWLSSVAAQAAAELMAFNAAPNHLAAKWHLERLLGIDKSISTEADLRAAFEGHENKVLRSLSDLIGVADPSEFVEMLSSIGQQECAPDLAWEADCALISQTWDLFTARTPDAGRTWGNWRIFITQRQRGTDLDAGVRLSTVHRAQGREFKAVALVGLNQGQFPDFRAKTPELLAAEVRAFYVAVTRPSRILLLTRPNSRMTRFGPRDAEPSEFFRFFDRNSAG